MKAVDGSITLLVLAVFAAGSAEAALLSRLGGQAWYDDALDISWLADANYAATSGYDDDGLMTWAGSQVWVAGLNTARHLGGHQWRLPSVVDTGTPGCNASNDGTDCGYNVQTADGSAVYSEMAHLYYVTLGNQAYCAPGGGCVAQPGWGLTYSGPFANLMADKYWSGTEYAPDSSEAWKFYFSDGYQRQHGKFAEHYAWAVHPGDIAAVPAPGVAWLVALSFALIGRRAAGRHSPTAGA